MKIIQNTALFLISITFIYFLSLSFTENILELNSSNFDLILRNSKYVLVKFDAPWCLHCKSFNSKYQEVSQQVAQQQLTEPIKIAQIDAFNDFNLSKKYNVKNYPSLLLFERGNLKAVMAEIKEPKDIINWLLKATGVTGQGFI